MNSVADKKWFVYLGDHHEGPHSLEEIQGKMSLGQVSNETYVWADGLADWKIITAVPELATLLDEPPPLPPVNPPHQDSQVNILPSTETQGYMVMTGSDNTTDPMPDYIPEVIPEPVLELKSSQNTHSGSNPKIVLEDATSGAGGTILLSKSKIDTVVPVELEPTSHKTYDNRIYDHLLKISTAKLPSERNYRPLVQLALAITIAFILGTAWKRGTFNPIFQSPKFKSISLAVMDFVQPKLLQLADQFPALGKWISPIPRLEDVSAEEYEELKNAARPKPEPGNIRLAMVLSKTDPLSPFFYLASNLPEKTVFHLFVIGVSETLLNQISFNFTSEIVFSNKLTQTKIIHFEDGKPLPRGEYKAYLTAAEKQPPEAKSLLDSLPGLTEIKGNPVNIPQNEKLLILKDYFLGGAKDESYTSRLKDFHDKLWKKSDDELKEISQFVNVFEAQLTSTQGKFSNLRRGKVNILQKREWDKFHNDWTKLQNNLSSNFPRIDPKSEKNDYFYWHLYQLIHQFGEDVQKLHAIHHAYFNGNQDLKTFEIQLGEASGSAHRELANVKVEIEKVQNRPRSPDHIPRGDGQ